MDNDAGLHDIGLKLIDSAILVEASLVELLREQAKILKKQYKNNFSFEELEKHSNIINNIIIALTLTNEKIKTGIELCLNEKNS